MKKKFTLWRVACMWLTVAALAACSADTDLLDETVVTPDGTTQVADSPSFFPVDDGARTLTGGTVAAKLRSLLLNIDPQTCLNISNLTITQEQYDEIKDTVDLYLAVPGDTRATYLNIFNWVITNVQYDYGTDGPLGSPDPYEVFKNKKCVCQGYANILRVMLHTQGIPCIGINGYLKTGYVQGHAWCYVYAGNVWYVSDPTSHVQFLINALDQYQSSHEPTSVDVPLIEDDNFVYSFRDGQLTVTGVKQCSHDYLTVPFSVDGMQITSFCPLSPIPGNVRTLYIGKNIQILGTAYLGLNDNAPSLETVEVDADNKLMSSYEGVVYRPKTSMTPYFIPKGIKRVVLKAMPTIEKNVLTYLPNLEEVVFSEGTKLISSYAIESCPNLKRVYVPESASMDPDAIYECGDSVEIVTVPTGIHDVTM